MCGLSCEVLTASLTIYAVPAILREIKAVKAPGVLSHIDHELVRSALIFEEDQVAHQLGYIALGVRKETGLIACLDKGQDNVLWNVHMDARITTVLYGRFTHSYGDFQASVTLPSQDLCQ
jgi:hypothetical protein